VSLPVIRRELGHSPPVLGVLFTTHNEVRFAVVPLSGGWLVGSRHWIYTGKRRNVCQIAEFP